MLVSCVSQLPPSTLNLQQGEIGNQVDEKRYSLDEKQMGITGWEPSVLEISRWTRKSGILALEKDVRECSDLAFFSCVVPEYFGSSRGQALFRRVVRIVVNGRPTKDTLLVYFSYFIVIFLDYVNLLSIVSVVCLDAFFLCVYFFSVVKL